MSETHEPLEAKVVAPEGSSERLAWPLGGMIILLLSLLGWGIILTVMRLLFS